MNAEYLKQIDAAFRELHNCSCEHVETVPVTELFRGQVAWDGEVEVMKLIGHPKAQVGYAWGFKEPNGRWEITAVLQIPPVNSPQTAVKIAIAAAAKNNFQRRPS